MQDIGEVIQQYVDGGELSGGSLLVRRGETVLYKNLWGYANIKAKAHIAQDSIYRMMSMTKPVTAVAFMKLVEQGKICLDEPVCSVLPEFAHARVVSDKRYEYHEGMSKLSLLQKLLLFRMDRVRTVPAARDITARDLLTHSSGLQQGIAGLIEYMKDKALRESLERQCEKYARQPLDFQPGTGTGYSPVAAYDVLARMIEVVSGKDAESYYRDELFAPLGMNDSGFHLTAAQEQRLVHVYTRKNGRLHDSTGTNNDVDGILHRGERYIAGGGGLYSSMGDYDRFAHMLLNEGERNGVRILKPETVKLIHTEGANQHLEPEPGYVWGLGVKIRQDPARGHSPCTQGTYGWSGAFGTHFFISPADDLSCVWLTNRTDLNGSGSYISRRIEELVFETYAKC